MQTVARFDHAIKKMLVAEALLEEAKMNLEDEKEIRVVIEDLKIARKHVDAARTDWIKNVGRDK